MLYPIIRRVRRPLLPVEDRPAVVAPVVSLVPAAEPETVDRTDKDKDDEHGQGDVRPDTVGATEAPIVADVPASAPAMELALTEEPAVSAPVLQETAKPTRTRHARKTKTEESSD